MSSSIQNSNFDGFVFTIDGLIGSGKSTILEYLHKNHGIPIDVEPVEKWVPYLKRMYEENTGTFEFQTRVWLDRCWIQPKKHVNIIIERSPLFQKYVFVEASAVNNTLTESERGILDEMYDKSMNMWNPRGYIYLRSDPDKCAERIKTRGRKCENGISIDYLQQLHELHEKAYMMASANRLPIICIDIEGKSVEKVATEVWTALQILGIRVKPKYHQHQHTHPKN